MENKQAQEAENNAGIHKRGSFGSRLKKRKTRVEGKKDRRPLDEGKIQKP